MTNITVGSSFGKWKVISVGHRPEGSLSRAKYFLCECQCPAKTRRMVIGRSLREGTSKSCGCIGPSQNTGKNEINKTYGKWTVLDEAKKPVHITGRGKYFLCECSCIHKTRRIISGHALRSGGSNNCGCKWRYSIRNVDAPFNMLLGNYINSANKRNKSFNLSLDDIKRLSQDICFYCGQQPMATLKPFGKHNFVYNGIDRIDNSLGYTIKNCVSCCKNCNTAKLDMNVDQFKNWITSVYLRLCK